MTSKVKATLLGKYETPIKLQIQLKNNRGDILSMLERLYTPVIRSTSTFIKTENGTKRVLAFYIKDTDILKETN